MEEKEDVVEEEQEEDANEEEETESSNPRKKQKRTGGTKVRYTTLPESLLIFVEQNAKKVTTELSPKRRTKGGKTVPAPEKRTQAKRKSKATTAAEIPGDINYKDILLFVKGNPT